MNSNKPENSITTDLLNSAKKRLGSNFWLSLLGVFIYQNYNYFLHLIYSKPEKYCYKYVKFLTDKYIIDGITWWIFLGYVLKALAISLTIYFLSLGFNFVKQLINGLVDAKSDYITKRKEEHYQVQLITDKIEFELNREKGELESLKAQNIVNKGNNEKEEKRLKELSDHLKKHETSVNNTVCIN